MKMIKILSILFLIFFTLPALSNEQSFKEWLSDFKKYALKKNISERRHIIILSKQTDETKISQLVSHSFSRCRETLIKIL